MTREFKHLSQVQGKARARTLTSGTVMVAELGGLPPSKGGGLILGKDSYT